MAEEELELETGGGSGGAKKSGLIKIVIIAGAALVLGVGGFFGWKMFFGGKETAKPPEAPAEAAKETAKETGGKEGGGKEGAKVGAVLNLEPFIVNLADPSGKRYLKLSLAVDAKEEKIKKEIETRMPMIRDSILLLLTSKTYADIAPTAGKLKLRTEVLKVFNNALSGVGTVHAVYFTEFVVQ